LIFEKLKFTDELKIDFYNDPLEYIRTRFEMKDKIDHWAFKWSHRILEEVMVRPEYDVK